MDGETENGAWKSVNATEFLFFDSTSNEPMPLRDTANGHYISRSIQVVGLVMSGLALFLAVATALWVFCNREQQRIKASQPIFLYMLCFGAPLVAPSSIFLSFDEGKGYREKQLDAMCSAFPWFFVIGYLTMYCALFSKLWRLSQLLQMRRRAVHINQVLLPFSILIASSLVVLIVWQVLSPYEWERGVISTLKAPLETYGKCRSVPHGLLPFIVPLGCLLFMAVGITAFYSWKLKDVQADLAESRWIFAGIFIHIQTLLVGIPGR
jgi:gamma-aminobutyric acid type B receptor